jgi:hypothetical protein
MHEGRDGIKRASFMAFRYALFLSMRSLAHHFALLKQFVDNHCDVKSEAQFSIFVVFLYFRQW